MLEKDGERIICVFNFSGNNYSTVMLNLEGLPVTDLPCKKILGTDKSGAVLNDGKIILTDLPAYSAQVYLLTL